MCLMSCSKLICFHNIHLEKFQNGYSNEATKTNGGLDAKGSYPNKIIHHIHYGASIFCRVLQKQKKSFKRSHILSIQPSIKCIHDDNVLLPSLAFASEVSSFLEMLYWNFIEVLLSKNFCYRCTLAFLLLPFKRPIAFLFIHFSKGNVLA